MPTGQDFVNLVKTRIGARYRYGAKADYRDPNYGKPGSGQNWDCAELVTWATYQIVKKLYGCEPSNDADYPDAYTGGWARDLDRGLLESCGVGTARKVPGAILLAFNDDTKHIVFSTGQGRTIGAQNHYIGVAYEPVDVIDWDYGILIPGVNY